MNRIVITLMGILIFGIIPLPAAAFTQWNFSGALHYMTFWNQTNSGETKTSDLQNGGGALNRDGKLEWGNQANSSITMRMQADALDGFLEMWWDDAHNSLQPREYWGRYRADDRISVIIGQQHQLYSSFISRQAGLSDLNMNGIGTAFRAPSPKIVLNYGGAGHPFFRDSGFSLALVQPETDKPLEMFDRTPGNIWAGATADIDSALPQLQASYVRYADIWRIKIAGAYQKTKLRSINSSISMPIMIEKKAQVIQTWLLTMDGDIAFGPLWLAVNATVGQNWGNAGLMNSEFGASLSSFRYSLGATAFAFDIQDIASGHFDIFDIVNAKGKWENTTSWMIGAVAAYHLTDALRLELGGGFRQDDNDIYATPHKLWNMYLQAAYTVTAGFEIVPEIGYLNRGKSPIDETGAGYLWYGGVQWNMHF